MARPSYIDASPRPRDMHQNAMDALVGYHSHIKTEAGVRIVRSLKITLVVLCFLSFPIAGFWAGGRYSELRNVSKEYLSQGKFAQIRSMLLTYHEQHGAFPPTKYQPKANGPIHSWRVLLVPYTDVDFKDRYSKYDFSQEWNSPNNLRAIGGMPYFYYFSIDADNDIANYLAIGDGDDWPSEKPLKSLLVTKGKDRFLVVEYSDSEIHWMEPKY